MKKTGDEYFDSQEFHELLDDYEKAVGSGQPVFMDADELAEIADYYQMTGHPDSAEAAITLALDLAPGAVVPLVYKIHEALYNNDIEEAERLLSQIIDTTNPEYVYVEGEIMLAKNMSDKADRYFREQFAHMQPDEYQDFIIDVASIFEDYGYDELAMAWMKRAKKEDTPDYKELMARTLFGMGKYKDSEKIWGELVDTDPFSNRYWAALSSAQFMNEDYSGAVQSSEYAIAIDPKDPQALIAKANGLYRLGNYEDALDYFHRYSELVPDDEYALMHQGICMVNLGRTEEAVVMLNRANDVAPSDSPYLCDICQEMAFALCEQQHFDEAMEWLVRTDDIECDHTQILVVKGHVKLASGDLEQAERYFRKAVIESDTPYTTLLRTIVSLYDNKYAEGAYQLFKSFFRIVPENFADGYAYMALCCYDLKKWDEFLAYLKQACELNPHECSLVLNHLFPEDVSPEDYYKYMVERIKG